MNNRGILSTHADRKVISLSGKTLLVYITLLGLVYRQRKKPSEFGLSRPVSGQKTPNC